MWFNDILLEFEDDINILYLDDEIDTSDEYYMNLRELVKLGKYGIVIRKYIYTKPIDTYPVRASDCLIYENSIIKFNSVSITDKNINHDNWFVPFAAGFINMTLETDDDTKPIIIYQIYLSNALRRKISSTTFHDECDFKYSSGMIFK